MEFDNYFLASAILFTINYNDGFIGNALYFAILSIIIFIISVYWTFIRKEKITVNSQKELLKVLKTSKKGDTIIFDEKRD